jgi:agmatinase
MADGGDIACSPFHIEAAIGQIDAGIDALLGAVRGVPRAGRRATEEGLLLEDHGVHVGLRGPLYVATDLSDDLALGFEIVRATDFDRVGAAAIAERIRTPIGDTPV